MQASPIVVQPGYYPPGQQQGGYPPSQPYPPGYGGIGAQAMPMMPLTPQPPPGCPPGLEYLTHVDQLLVHQQVELFEGRPMSFVNLTLHGHMQYKYFLVGDTVCYFENG